MRRLSERATAVHVLMCASAHDRRLSLVEMNVPTVSEISLDEFGASPLTMVRIVRLRKEAQMLAYTYGDSCLEAAYRLIESSPTLRREWFGAK